MGEKTWWRGSLVESILYVRVLDVKILKLLRLELNFIRAKVELGWKFKQIDWLRISLEKICNYFRKMQPSINQMSEKFHCYICGGFCANVGSELVQIRLTLDFNSSLDSIDRERDLFRVFHYIKMISVLKTFFFLNVNTYPIPVTNIKNSYLYFSGKLGPCHLSLFINFISIYLNP